MKILIAGAGGFIGGHLVKRLLGLGHEVRAADIKPLDEWWQVHPESQYHPHCDLSLRENCLWACRDVEWVFHLAANIGGIGWITKSHADIARDNTLIDLHMLEAAWQCGVERFLWSSSACAYPQYRQKEPTVTPLTEEMAWPADPEPGYGLAKLYTEELCKYYSEDYGLSVRVVRFHNAYGKLGSWRDGKEKAPAAACRKIAEAPDGGTVEIWGDGQQTRSFMHIDDCVEGLVRLMNSDYQQPLNLGTSELVTIDQLFQTVAEVAGKTLTFVHNLTKPQGVRGRNSDNTRLREVLGWEPNTPLRLGLERTYPWILEQVQKHGQ